MLLLTPTPKQVKNNTLYITKNSPSVKTLRRKLKVSREYIEESTYYPCRATTAHFPLPPLIWVFTSCLWYYELRSLYGSGLFFSHLPFALLACTAEYVTILFQVLQQFPFKHQVQIPRHSPGSPSWPMPPIVVCLQTPLHTTPLQMTNSTGCSWILQFLWPSIGWNSHGISSLFLKTI